MEFFAKLEKRILGWFKGVPHLPVGGQKWLGDNVWWIVLVGAILTTLSIIASLSGIIALVALLGSPQASYYASSVITSWTLVTGIVGVVFALFGAILQYLSVQPLKLKQKKGWVLLFVNWLLGAIAIFINSVLTLNPISFIVSLLFGAVWVAISGYFLFELHGQFAHDVRRPHKATPKK